MLVEVNGDRMRLEYAYAARYSKTGYEPLIHEAFTTTVRSGMVVLDVGAHVGFFTLAAALRVGPTGRVFAFEPAPETAAILARHVAMNGWGDRVEVVRSALSDREGTLPFFTLGTTMAASLSREHVEASPEVHTSAPEEVSVPAVSLDGFCASRAVVPDRIKIDVEGAEVMVLRGARHVLDSDAEILCEVHPAAIGLFGSSVDELHELAAGAGRRPIPVDSPNELGIYHVLLRRAAGG